MLEFTRENIIEYANDVLGRKYENDCNKTVVYPDNNKYIIYCYEINSSKSTFVPKDKLRKWLRNRVIESILD